jgi:hypothetical protein
MWESPIPLWKILEDEYCEVHGRLPQSYETEREKVIAEFHSLLREGALRAEDRQAWQNQKILPLLYRSTHLLPEKRTALCLSGGGIRSATFALGVLQGLAKARLLTRFDFLSTVSGGGYIGAWLTAWSERHKEGRRGVAQELAATAPLPLRPEPEPIAHLREYSNYLAPKLGLLSADTWTLVASYLRNVALNLLVILPIFAVVLAVPRLVVRAIEWLEVRSDSVAGLPRALVFATLIAGSACQVVAFCFLERSRPIVRGHSAASGSVRSRPGQGAVLLWYWLPLLLASGLLPLSAWGMKWSARPWPSGIAAHLPGWATAFGRHLEAHTEVSFLGLQMLVMTAAWLLAIRSVQQRTGGGLIAMLGDWAAHIVAATVAGWILWFAFRQQLFAHRRPYLVFAPPIYLLTVLTAGTLVRGLGSYWSSDDDREWSARAAAWILIACATWFVISEIVFFGPSYLIRAGPVLKGLLLSGGGLSALATALLANSGRTPATQELKAKPGSSANPDEGGKRAAAPILQQLGLAIAAPLFFAFILLLVVLGTDWLLVRAPLYGRQLDEHQVDSALNARAAFVTWLREQEQTLQRMTDPDPARRQMLSATDVARWQGAQQRLAKLLEHGADPPAGRDAALALPFQPDEKGLQWLSSTGTATANSLAEHLGNDELVIDLLKQRLRGTKPGPAPSLTQNAESDQVGVIQILAVEDPELGLVLQGEDWHSVILKQATVGQTAAWMVGFAALSLLMGAVININAFSLHGIYRNRLIRAYLAASRLERSRRGTFDRFTGFDGGDDIPLHQLRDNNARGHHGPVISDLMFWSQFLRGASPEHDQLSAEEAESVYKWVRAQLPGAADALQKDSSEVPAGFESTLQSELDTLVKTDLSNQPELVSLLTKDELAAPPSAVTASADLQRDAPTLRTRVRHNCLLLYRAFPYGIARPGRLFHVLNMALNVVAGKRLAWQQRKAQSFTATALHCGSYPLGYRSSLYYGGGHAAASPFKSGPMTLGTAVAISGAAANPNWGYHSSPFVAFLMTLLNVRLGVWLGNPGTPGSKGIGKRHRLPAFGNSAPLFAWRPLLSDAFALTDDTHPYVSLSDGGHFDNLGLYEMVLRRCHLIVLSDAGQDSRFTFEDLGNAIRKIRIDLGVPILFEGRIPICPRGVEPPLRATPYCAVGTIKYSAVDPGGQDGTLIYIKPTFYGGEPTDVYNYGQQSPAFPHESTADQFFTEAQFESYRHLGEYIVTRIYTATERGYGLLRFLAGPRSHLHLPTVFSIRAEANKGQDGKGNVKGGDNGG